MTGIARYFLAFALGCSLKSDGPTWTIYFPDNFSDVSVCSESATGSGFWLAAQGKMCGDFSRGIAFVSEWNLEDRVLNIEDAEKMCEHGATVSLPWVICNGQGSGIKSVALKQCGPKANDGIVYTITRYGNEEDKLMEEMAEFIRLNIILRCPSLMPQK